MLKEAASAGKQVMVGKNNGRMSPTPVVLRARSRLFRAQHRPFKIQGIGDGFVIAPISVSRPGGRWPIPKPKPRQE
jgi:hypothetical protein